MASVGGRGQRIIIGRTHSLFQRENLALNEAPLRLRGAVKISHVRVLLPHWLRCGPQTSGTSVTWGLVINAESWASYQTFGIRAILSRMPKVKTLDSISCLGSSGGGRGGAGGGAVGRKAQE